MLNRPQTKALALSCAAAVLTVIGADRARADVDGTIGVAANVPVVPLSCSLGTFGDVDFGDIPVDIGAGGVTGSGTIAFTCNKDANVVVEILGSVARTLDNGTGIGNNTLNYVLNQPDGTGADSGALWGEDVDNAAHVAAVTKNVEKTLNVHAAISGSQTADDGTAYADTPTVRVNF